MPEWYEGMAEDDFSRARTRELLSRVSGLMDPARQHLLPLEEVLAILKPESEIYVGMDAVPLDRIVGSEGRYRDFDRHFLPRRDFLRNRWISVDMAHYKDVPLPPIRIYEIGGVYFVRDGNHRVSVAKARGQAMIDAEVTRLGSVVALRPGMTLEEIRRELVAYEKRRFYERTGYGRITGDESLDFTSPGRYDQVLEHVLVHKYYANQGMKEEMPFEDALRSWHGSVYSPVVAAIEEEGLLSRFPGRTASDLYMFIVQHWDELKRKYGLTYPIGDAARDFGARFGNTAIQRVAARIKEIAARAAAFVSRILRGR
jgi:hypothetical protein